MPAPSFLGGTSPPGSTKHFYRRKLLMATKAEVVPAERDVKPIKPDAVTIDLKSHTRKWVIVDLDPGITLQDLNDRPNIWQQVQGDRQGRALAPNDVVELRGDGWTATGMVNCIDANAVHLYGIERKS